MRLWRVRGLMVYSTAAETQSSLWTVAWSIEKAPEVESQWILARRTLAVQLQQEGSKGKPSFLISLLSPGQQGNG